MKTYKVTVIEPGTSTFDPDLCFTKTVQATGRKDAQRKALIDERDSCYVSEVIVKENTIYPYSTLVLLHSIALCLKMGA